MLAIDESQVYLYCSAFCAVSVLTRASGGSGSVSPAAPAAGDWNKRTFLPPGDDILNASFPQP